MQISKVLIAIGNEEREWQWQRHKLRIWLVEWGKISVRHVRHALVNKSVPSSAKQQREITKITVFLTTWAYNRKSLILCI